MVDPINKRKSEHIRIALNEKVSGENITNGFQDFQFIHNALPEINFNDITYDTTFLNKRVRTPFLISSMTGGAELAETINSNLAKAAEMKGWSFALGSTRALIESKEFRPSFQLRKYAPSIPIIANLGAVQLNYGFGVEECQKIIEITEADALVLHLNSIQEVIQQGGNVNFKELLVKIEKICSRLNVPVGVKEVGWGIDGTVAKHLVSVGVAFIDVAGAGGTSWSQVEKLRSKEPVRKLAAEAFADWGIPTASCITAVKSSVDKESIIASGGMTTGVEAAKAIALGADLVGFGRSILREATHSLEELIHSFEVKEMELKMAMFGIGSSNLDELKRTNRLVKN